MAITAEYMNIDSECQLFRVISSSYLENKIERSVYNRRRRKLFDFIDLMKANVHNIHYLEDVKNKINNCVLLGDKGYLSIEKQVDLFKSSNIKLETLMRKNK